MITAYFTNINNLKDGEFHRLLDKAAPDIRGKVLFYRSIQEQKRRLCGKLLLYKLLAQYYPEQDISKEPLKYDPWGKPYIGNDLDFNISHSGDMVICAAVRGAKIGVDTEQETLRDINNMREYFTDKEWSKIVSGADANTMFYKMWARKEAYVKAIGKGMFLPLHEIDVCEDEVTTDGSQWFLHEQDIMKGYAACIVTNEQSAEVNITEVTINTLVNQ